MENPELSQSASVYGFAAWLTTRKEPITAGSSHDSAPMAELLERFCETNNLGYPEEGWEENLKFPKEE